MTQENLAELVGVDATSISSVETGKYFFSAENLLKLSEAFEVNVCELFHFENLESKEKTYKEILNILAIFKEDSMKLNAIKNFLKALV